MFCLEREQWVNCIGHFHGDHFRSVADHPELELEYDNLLYVCQACNLRKGKQSVANPLDALLSSDVTVSRNGSIQGHTKEAKELIDLLRLDSVSYRKRRRMMLEIIAIAAKYNRTLYRELMGFPDDLPDLARLQPPEGNSRPNGVKNSCSAQRERKKLPAIY